MRLRASGSTSIGSDGVKPEVVEGLLGLRYEDILYDPIQDQFLTKDEYFEVVAADPGRTIIGYNPARNEWLPLWLRGLPRLLSHWGRLRRRWEKRDHISSGTSRATIRALQCS